ncbi:hypothetical protein KQX54_009029 [Cotesia glomerata]|uniref:Uncharacterized protein n=1 Tax=Cotesia glomerata TaxID=32391 RepID=A0AAV7J097_COTGL|nr:hypothetical protein KQX54_009029 [Cotesia glomerata]
MVFSFLMYLSYSKLDTKEQNGRGIGGLILLSASTADLKLRGLAFIQPILAMQMHQHLGDVTPMHNAAKRQYESPR